MGKRKWMGIYIAVLAALLVGPSLSVAAGPELINNSFVLGDSGCQMNIALDGGTGAIVSADLGPAFEPPPPPSPPPPTGNSFNFTGSVFFIDGLVPFGVEEGTTISGNITYNPSNFMVSSTDTYSTTYEGVNTVGVDVARIWVIYNIGPDTLQRFQTHNNSFVRSTVINNSPEGIDPVPADYFAVFTDIMDAIPTVLDTPINSDFVLKNENGTAIDSMDIPTDLNSINWDPLISYFTVYKPGIEGWAVTATIENLTPAISPSPPTIAVASPAVQQTSAPDWCSGQLTKESIRDTLVCKDCTDLDGDGIYTCSLADCETKTAVERNIMEKSGDGSTYCYYDKLGNRICKTIP